MDQNEFNTIVTILKFRKRNVEEILTNVKIDLRKTENQIRIESLAMAQLRKLYKFVNGDEHTRKDYYDHTNDTLSQEFFGATISELNEEFSRNNVQTGNIISREGDHIAYLYYDEIYAVDRGVDGDREYVRPFLIFCFALFYRLVLYKLSKYYELL